MANADDRYVLLDDDDDADEALLMDDCCRASFVHSFNGMVVEDELFVMLLPLLLLL